MPRQKKEQQKPSLSDYYLQLAKARRTMAKAREEFQSGYEQTVQSRGFFSIGNNPSSAQVARNIRSSIALTDSRNRLAQQDEAVAQMYERLAEHYKGNPDYAAGKDWVDPHKDAFNKFKVQGLSTGPFSARAQAALNNLKASRGFRAVAFVYGSLGSAYKDAKALVQKWSEEASMAAESDIKAVEKSEKENASSDKVSDVDAIIDEVSSEPGKSTDLSSDDKLNGLMDQIGVTVGDTSEYERLILESKGSEYYGDPTVKVDTLMKRIDSLDMLSDSDIGHVREKLSIELADAVLGIDQQDAYESRINMLREMDTLSKLKSFDNPLTESKYSVEGNTTYRRIVSDFTQATLGYNFLVDQYSQMGDAYAEKVQSLKESRDATLMSLQATSELGIAEAKGSSFDTLVATGSVLDRAKARVAEVTGESEYPDVILQAIESSDKSIVKVRLNMIQSEFVSSDVAPYMGNIKWKPLDAISDDAELASSLEQQEEHSEDVVKSENDLSNSALDDAKAAEALKKRASSGKDKFERSSSFDEISM